MGRDMADLGSETNKAPIAFLEVYRRASAEDVFRDSGTALPIFPNDEFYFGRSPDWWNPTVSNRHLHIHCIIFEEDNTSGIPPLIYVQDLSANGTYLSQLTTEPQWSTEKRLSRRESHLLANGDELRISPTLSLRFNYSLALKFSNYGLTREQRREAELFRERYTITDQILGSGGHGKVFVAIHKRTSRQLACKIVEISMPRDDSVHQISAIDAANTLSGSPRRRGRNQQTRDAILNSIEFREFDILKELNHPNIVHLEKVFWSSKTIYIFQELVTGGDLFSYIEHKGGRVADLESAVILFQLLRGIEYLHDRDIVHRDLKPDNVLINTTNDTFRVIITDFGNSRRVKGFGNAREAKQMIKQRMFSVVGTLEYAAPEIHCRNPLLQQSEGYSKAVDMWSIGAIATALLSGDVIFTNRLDPLIRYDPRAVILGLSSKCDLSVLDNPYSTWRNVGSRPKDFIKKLLVLDESQRLDVKQALAHELFTDQRYISDLEAVYQKSITAWEPRRPVFRVIEALDLNRLKPSSTALEVQKPGKSHFFNPISVCSTQNYFAYAKLNSSGSPQIKPVRPTLSTIGEEATPEPDTPTSSALVLPMAPRKSKIRNRLPLLSTVHENLSELDLNVDAITPETSVDVDMSGVDMKPIIEPERNHIDGLDLPGFVVDGPVIINQTPSPSMRNCSQDVKGLSETVDETPPMVASSPIERKRPRPFELPGVEVYSNQSDTNTDMIVVSLNKKKLRVE